MTEKYGSGRFCSRSCANSRTFSKESNSKRSKSVRNTYYLKHPEALTPKDKVCNICGERNCTNTFCKDGSKKSQINTLIKYFGFNKDSLGTQDVIQEWEFIRTRLFKLYWIDKKSSTEIAEMFNYPSPCNITGKVFKYLTIPTKTCKQSCYENLLFNRWTGGTGKSRYQCGWHKTWYMQNVYLRSSYEFEYAQQLDAKHVYYEVENQNIRYFDTQQGKYRFARPDFFITDSNTIVEVKSTYTLDKQNMIDKAIQYIKLGYNFILCLDKKDYSYEELLQLNDPLAQKEEHVTLFTGCESSIKKPAHLQLEDSGQY